ncbi:MAG: hypothetical protein ACI83W_000593 [Marinoscillum sp.]|jgi:hypothetical protein
MKHPSTLTQINHYLKRYEKSFGWIVKGSIAVACLWLIFDKVEFKDLDFTGLEMSVFHWRLILLSIALMPLNWWLEAQRWCVAMNTPEVDIKVAMSQVLAGLSLNWLLPFTMGDAAARLSGEMSLKKKTKALLASRAVMLCITIIFGAISLLYFWQLSRFWLLLIIPILAPLLILFKRQFTQLWTTVWLKVIAISVLRYAVFTIQFILVFLALLPALTLLTVILGVGWIFFFRTVTPSILGNLGVREASALVFFEQTIADNGQVLLACLAIWFINTIIPSIAGIPFVFKLKYKPAL